ncbi:MAG: M14 family zinc carboxypeptidase, partial [Bacteroidota bacterium]
TVYNATRTNANGYDLNRNYPNMVNNPSAPVQAETQAMIELTDSIRFVMSANMHGGTEVVNFPWDSWVSSEKTHADHSWWQFVSREYADTARSYSPSTYFDGFDNGITHGGDWYVVYGSRQDYMNYYKNQRELTLEISDTKLLPPTLLPEHWEYNYRSLLNYIAQSLYGIQGVVTDLYSGEPLEAKVEIIDHDQDNSFVYSELPNGEFFRPVIEGSYDLKFSSQGYHDLIIQDVTIENYEDVYLNVQMVGENPFAPPAELVAHTGNNNVVYLSWQEPNTNNDYDFIEPDSYQVFRDEELIGETTETSFFDENLTAGTYEYFVKAYYADQDGVSFPSNIVSVTLDDEVNYYTITATSNEYGSIDPEGEIRVEQGYDQSFVFLPDDGFIVHDIIVDGESVDIDDSYLFSNVSADHTIHVDFIEDPSQQEFSVTFIITDLFSQPIEHAVIEFDGDTQEAGEYVFENISPGNYFYTLTADGYEIHEGETEVIDQDIDIEVQLVPVDVATHQNDSTQNIVFYPNPTSGVLNVKSNVTIERIIVSDLSGRQIFEYQPKASDFNISLDHFSSGVYLISVLHTHGVYTGKIELESDD